VEVYTSNTDACAFPVGKFCARPALTERAVMRGVRSDRICRQKQRVLGSCKHSDFLCDSVDSLAAFGFVGKHTECSTVEFLRRVKSEVARVPTLLSIQILIISTKQLPRLPFNQITYEYCICVYRTFTLTCFIIAIKNWSNDLFSLKINLIYNFVRNTSFRILINVFFV